MLIDKSLPAVPEIIVKGVGDKYLSLLLHILLKGLISIVSHDLSKLILCISLNTLQVCSLYACLASASSCVEVLVHPVKGKMP